MTIRARLVRRAWVTPYRVRMRAAVMRDLGVAGVVATCALLSGCAGAPAVPGPAVPTFPPTSATADPADATPLDPCAALIEPADVANVLGLDVVTVSVRTVRGLPAPAVGRTARIDCEYTGAKGRVLFDVRNSTFDSAAAAQQQWQLNSGQESGTPTFMVIGPGSGMLFDRPGEQLLSLVAGSATLALQVPDATVPVDRGRRNLIVDFAQRALKAEPAEPAAEATDRKSVV